MLDTFHSHGFHSIENEGGNASFHEKKKREFDMFIPPSSFFSVSFFEYLMHIRVYCPIQSYAKQFPF